LIGGFKNIYNNEGVRGLFKGNGLNCAINAPFNALEFFFYEFFKNHIFKIPNNETLTFGRKFVCGGCAGVIA